MHKPAEPNTLLSLLTSVAQFEQPRVSNCSCNPEKKNGTAKEYGQLSLTPVLTQPTEPHVYGYWLIHYSLQKTLSIGGALPADTA